MTKFTKVLSASLLASTAFAFTSHASVVINVEEVAAPKSVFVSANSHFKLNTKEGVVEFPGLIIRGDGVDTMTADTTDYSKKGATVTLEEDRVASQLARFFDVVKTAKQEKLFAGRKEALEASKADLTYMIEYVEALKAAYDKAHASASYRASSSYYVEAITPVRKEFEEKLVTRDYEAFAKPATVENKADYKKPAAPLTDTLVSKPFAQDIKKSTFKTGFDLTEGAARKLLLDSEDVVAEMKRCADLSDKLDALLSNDKSVKYGLQYMQASIKAEKEATEKAEAEAAAAVLAAAQVEDSKGKEEEVVEEEK